MLFQDQLACQCRGTSPPCNATWGVVCGIVPIKVCRHLHYVQVTMSNWEAKEGLTNAQVSYGALDVLVCLALSVALLIMLVSSALMCLHRSKKD